jgi:hypothetical protein
MKRQREQAKRERRQMKEERRAQRKAGEGEGVEGVEGSIDPDLGELVMEGVPIEESK